MPNANLGFCFYFVFAFIPLFTFGLELGLFIKYRCILPNQILKMGPGTVAQAHHPSYLGDRDLKDGTLRKV
jgi:hypothetical protein